MPSWQKGEHEMATTYILAVGKMDSAGADLRVDWRLAELLEWQAETLRPLPLPVDLIIWLEDRGFVTDLLTGETTRLAPLQQTIDFAAELQELQDDCADREFWASGGW
jgi:hypothetical protein